MVLMMDSLKTTVFALVLTVSLSGHVSGQLSRLQYADRQYGLENFRLAADEYAKAYSTKPDYGTARKAAQSLDRIHAYAESYGWWKLAAGYPKAGKDDFSALLRAGYRSVQNYDPATDLEGSPYTVGDLEEFAGPADQSSYRQYGLKALDGLNSEASDYSLSGSGESGQFFASNRGNGGQNRKTRLRLDAKGKGFATDFYKSDGKSYYGIYTLDAEGNVIRVSVEGYGLYHLSDPQMLPGGKLLFSATPDRLSKKDRVVFPGLFYGTYDAAAHTVKDVKAFPYNRTDEFAVISPGVDTEQGRIYFSSNRPGGQGGYDLYYVNYDENMDFSEPVNLGSGINSAFNERDAFRAGEEFYFSSDRKGGYGGLDVYVSKSVEGSFGEAVNMGRPVNSTADDFGFSMHSEGEAYLSSNRAGSRGYDDLYGVSWSERNLKLFLVDGSGRPLEEGTKILLQDGTKSTDISKADEKTLVGLTEKGGTYTFSASRPGYFNQKLTVTLSGDQEEIRFEMVAVPYGLEVYEANIYYDLDKDFLRELSREKLEEITAWMLKYPELNLVIESHTDSRASDRYNQRLSERRARSVTKYLEEKGVMGERVSAAWFSESRPVNECGDGVRCPDSKHQLNRRSELKLIAFPDRNRSYDLPAGASVADFQSAESARKWFIGY
jgi:outer membrane protein OmpA-like peptidoglycan-associated protein